MVHIWGKGLLKAIYSTASAFLGYDNKIEELNKGKHPWGSFCHGDIIDNWFKYILCISFMNCDFEALVIFRKCWRNVLVVFKRVVF